MPEKACLSPWKWALAAAAAPAVIAVAQLGRIHPDEVYQTLEPAYFRAFGYGILAWEWQQGLRNWAIPIFFSWLLQGSAALGLTHPLAYRAVLEVPQYLLHAAFLLAVYRHAARQLSPSWARWAILAVGLSAPVLTFAGRTMGESFSTAFLLLGLVALEPESVRRRQALLGGGMLGLAVVARYGSAAAVLAAMLWLLLARRFRSFLFCALGGLAVALLLGALDWASWGKPFHSLLTYLEFNLFSGGAAAQFGRERAHFYLGPLLESAPGWVWPALALGAVKLRGRLPLPAFSALGYLAAIALTPHKEARFLYPGLVLLAVAAAPFALSALSRLRRPDLGGALTALLFCLSLGPYFLETSLSVQRPDQFRAIVRASRGAEVTGLLIVNEGLWGAGGSFYVGKQIPWLTCDWPQEPAFRGAMADPRFNRAVSYQGRALPELEAAGFQVLEQIGRATVLARR